MTITIWRVENDRGEGPYTSDWPWREILQGEHANPYTHPWPSVVVQDLDYPYTAKPEFDKVPHDIYKYGFPTKAHALEWFAGWFQRLTEWGYYLKVIEVRQVIPSNSGKQVAFK
jgi:hypothetical protein